jgi:hypothetical protein
MSMYLPLSQSFGGVRGYTVAANACVHVGGHRSVSQDEPPQPTDASLEPGMPSPGPAWHRARMEPAAEVAASATPGEDAAGDSAPAATGAVAGGDASRPAGPPSSAVAVEPPAPSAPGGGHLAAGIFLTVGGLSLFAGLIELLDAQSVGFPANAVACGIAFAVLFILSVALPGGRSAMRSTFGVVAVLFLVACFGFAVDLSSSAGATDQSLRVKLAGAAAVFTVGQAVVGVVVPSAVAAGLAVLGFEGMVLLSLVAGGSPSSLDLTVAGMVTAIALAVVALRAPRLRPHPSGLAWMVGVAAVLAATAAVFLGAGINGVAAAAAGSLILALALIAWRHHAVVPAIAAAPVLLVVEAYVVDQVAGQSTPTGQAVTVLASAAVLLVLAGIGAVAARRWTLARGDLRVRAEEVLLVVAAVFALIALGQPSRSPFPFLRNGFGARVQPVQPTLPSQPEAPTLPAFPTFPSLPPG